MINRVITDADCPSVRLNNLRIQVFPYHHGIQVYSDYRNPDFQIKLIMMKQNSFFYV